MRKMPSLRPNSKVKGELSIPPASVGPVGKSRELGV